jgi:translation initiation factor IF-3
MKRRFKFKKADKNKAKKNFKANERILSDQVRLIDEGGKNHGVVDTFKALDMAKEVGLDLVEVNPKPDIPVAKIIDLGQLKYEQDKKINKQRALQKKVELKNVRLSFRISKHDLDIRVGQAVRFLSRGNKTKIEINLKGREKQHFERAREMMLNFVQEVKNKVDFEVEEEQPLTKQPGGFSIVLVSKK